MVRTPGVWNRVPKNLRNLVDLSRPDVDMSIGINPLNPIIIPFESKPSSKHSCHPLSSKGMRIVVVDPSTREKAPFKNTLILLNFATTHELTIVELKPDGTWRKQKRSTEIRITQSQVCNAMYFQLGYIAQFAIDVPLDSDTTFNRFVLSMTICGEM
jgi:hypothetical protein